MQSDLPHTLYNYKESGESQGKKKTVASDEVIRLQEEANRELARRKAAEKKGDEPYDLEELYK